MHFFAGYPSDDTEQPALPRRRGPTTAIDLPADLHFEDDDGLVLARTSGAASPKSLRAGTLLVAGSADAWSWAEVVSVDDGWAHLRTLTTAQEAAKPNLVAPVPESA